MCSFLVGSFLTRGNPVFKRKCVWNVRVQTGNSGDDRALLSHGPGGFFLSFSFCGFKVFILSVTQCYLHRDRRGWEVSRLLSSSWQADPYCSLLSSETEGRSRGGSTGIQAEDDSGNVLYIIIRHWGLNLYLSLSSTNSHTVTQSYQPLDLWDRVIMGTCKSILPGVRICACGWTNNSSTNQRRMSNGLLENNGGFSRCRRRCCSNSSVRAGE